MDADEEVEDDEKFYLADLGRGDDDGANALLRRRCVGKSSQEK